MCKEIFMNERMTYLQTVKGYSVIKSYNIALKEWESQRNNTSLNYEDLIDDREELING